MVTTATTEDLKSIWLFATKVPFVVPKELVYDPDTDGLDYANSNKIIPALKSIIVSKLGTDKYRLQVVDAIDPRTQKVTLAEVGWITSTISDDEITKILTYSRDKWYIYFDKRVKPTKLFISSLLLINGIDNVKYRLLQSVDGEYVPFSIYKNADGTYGDENIPLVAIEGKESIKQATNCHTLRTPVEGELITFQGFNSLGVQTCELYLILREGALINTLTGSTSPIVTFDATSFQTLGTDFFLNQRQDPSHLGISPYIVYADGTREVIPVDNQRCFIYGLDDLIPSYPGRKQEILIKYYLNARQVSPLETTNGKNRYLSIRKNVVVMPDNSTYGVKLSVVPYWDSSVGKYKLKFYIYTERKDTMTDVTQYVTVSNFDGNLFYNDQSVILDLDLTHVFTNISSMPYRQLCCLKLFPHTNFMQWILRESATADIAYGVQSSTFNRPVIDYDTTSSRYFIASSVFPSVDKFLEAFYYNSSPMAESEASLEPIIPTHFTVRNAYTGSVIIAAPISVSEYAKAWNTSVGAAGVYSGDIVLVEFLQFLNGNYNILYGAPVNVRTSTVPYVGD